MEPASSSTNLEQRISEWQLRLSGSSLTKEDIEELSTQLRDSFAEFSTKELNEDDAWLLATHRLGTPKLLHEEFKKVNPDFILSRNWTMLLWGAMGFSLLQCLFLQMPIILNYIRFPWQKDSSYGSIEFYTMAGITALLTAYLAIKWRKFIIWFDNALINNSFALVLSTVVLGIVGACVNILISSKSLGGNMAQGDLRQAYYTLIFTFYLTLIGLNAYITFRYRIQELRSFKTFIKSISWKNAFIFGFICQIFILFTMSFRINYLHFIFIIPSFGVVGWMLYNSQDRLLNLMAAQAIPMLMLIFGLTISLLGGGLAMEYITTLLALALGFAIARFQNIKTSLT